MNHGKFMAGISFKRKKYWLGYFPTVEAAAEAYAKAKRQLHTFHPETSQ